MPIERDGVKIPTMDERTLVTKRANAVIKSALVSIGRKELFRPLSEGEVLHVIMQWEPLRKGGEEDEGMV